jgi:hypothetical protein
MVNKKRTTTWILLALGILAAILALELHRRPPIVLKGTVLRQDADPNKQLPIGEVEITATNGVGIGNFKSDPSGFFRITLPKGLRRRQPVTLEFRHDEYQPLTIHDYVGDQIYIARMVPISRPTTAETHRSDVLVSNARVRYSVKATTEADVGSTVKTFQVANTGNAPCNKRPPCSPDGKWKAAIASMSLDAGEGNEFRNARVSCIAGPCPFTKIELENLAQDGRRFNVSVRNWSDTATFLLEAEVVHPMVSDIVRESYPVIFGRALNFSLPATAEGPSMEAELDGEAIVFPLGPDLFLRWADCHIGLDKDQSRTYRCELKPGYQFR